MKYLAATLLLLSVFSVCRACDNPLVLNIGVVPWASAQFNYVWANRINTHLKPYCIKGRFSSAKNFHEFIKKTLNNQFDVVNVPPNVGSYLMTEHKMPVIAMEDWQAELYIIVRNTSKIQSLADINNATVALPDPLSMVSMIATPIIQPYSQNIQYHAHHNAVFKSVLSSNAQVGGIISPIYNSLKAIHQDRIRIIYKELKKIPGLLINSNQLTQAHSKELLTALSTFDSENSRIWQKWLKPNKHALQALNVEQAIFVKQISEYLESKKEREKR